LKQVLAKFAEGLWRTRLVFAPQRNGHIYRAYTDAQADVLDTIPEYRDTGLTEARSKPGQVSSEEPVKQFVDIFNLGTVEHR
jgi:hypothetical protein